MKLFNKYILEAIQRGIKLALDDFEEDEIQDQEHILSKRKVLNYDAEKDMWLFENFVDLGLPSGTLWCKYNLGCDWDKLNNNPKRTSRKQWIGNYYAWGETKEKDKTLFNWDNYKWCNINSDQTVEITKYYTKSGYEYTHISGKIDNLTQLELNDDAAYLFDSKMKMPTREQYKELIDNTTHKWVNNYKDIKNLYGCLLTSKINRNQLFIPACGVIQVRYDDNLDFMHKTPNKFSADIECHLWTADITTSNPKNAAIFVAYVFRPNQPLYSIRISDQSRASGVCIRPVLNK